MRRKIRTLIRKCSFLSQRNEAIFIFDDADNIFVYDERKIDNVLK